MNKSDAIVFGDMDRSSIEALLTRNHVGRLAFTQRGRIDMTPVHYVYDHGWIYGRMSRGAKYRAVTQTAYKWVPVVFEVDEVDGLFDWRSVVVHGGFYLLSADNGTPDDELSKALHLVRKLVPSALTGTDPVPERDVLFRISADDASGRSASLSTARGEACEIHA